MQQKELATLLDISPAMVSRLVKRGMPTDTIERAERWRRRHLEPGRVKGSRVDTVKRPAQQDPPKVTSPSTAPPRVSLNDTENMGVLVDAALANGNQYGAAVRTHQLRVLLRQMANDADLVRLPLRVWVALLDYMLHEEAEVRSKSHAGGPLTAEAVCLFLGEANWVAGVVLEEACDFDDNALNGWPDYPDDED